MEDNNSEPKLGLKIPRYYTKEALSPFEMFQYEQRSSTIKNPDGSIVFHLDQVEVPHFWSHLATDILAQKYFRKAGVPLPNGTSGSEHSIKQVAHRMAGCWKWWGEKYHYFSSEEDAQIFYDEMVYMIINQTAAPNSPQWFTTGLNFAYNLTGQAQGHSYINPETKKLEYSQDAYTRTQPHACFVQELKDDLVKPGGIFDLLIKEARIFKYGSGSGTNFSRLRGKGEKLSGGGTSSGTMSFMKIFDAAAGSIKSGGTTRRAAKMVCLDLEHPEIEDFIWWKVREEEKVAGLVAGSKILRKRLSKLMELIQTKINTNNNNSNNNTNNNSENSLHFSENIFADKEICRALKQAAKDQIPLSYLLRAVELAQQGYKLPLQEFNVDYESEAYQTVSGQNSNNSIRIPNSFFQALQENKEWELKARADESVVKKISAKKLWDEIGYCAWASADPGVQFDTTINEWHTCPNDGKINASNPCSEFHFLDDTACNLASLNLTKFYDEESGIFDVEGYKHAIRLWTVALEISVLMAHFPSENIARNSYSYRALGLGYANIGTLLMLQGIPYDSDKGRTIAAALASIMTGEAYAASAEMASFLGPFERYEANREAMLRVIRNHRHAAYAREEYENLTVKPIALNQNLCSLQLLNAAQDAWDKAWQKGGQYGYRNANISVMAPTGTIGLVMDCDTTGIEPDYALVKMKKLAGGGYFKIVNQAVPKALKKLGYNTEQVKEIVAYCIGHGTLENCPLINKNSLLERGLNEEQLKSVEKELGKTMHLNFVFNSRTLGEEHYQKMMLGKEGHFLNILGFTNEEIEIANEYICGTMMLEGAPHLREEHYPIFDCASRCGKKGKRCIAPYGHLNMVAAVQPFISGAISKTINMPKEATIEQIKKAYYDAWTMMIKGVALYRDGCKLSQPLNTTLEENVELKKILLESTDETEEGNEEKAQNRKREVLYLVKKKLFIGQKELTLIGKLEEGKGTEENKLEKEKLKELKVEWKGTIPTQELMLQTLVNMINLSLQNGLSPNVIAEQSLNLEGHPLISELRTFLLEFAVDEQTTLPKFTTKITGDRITENALAENFAEQKIDLQRAERVEVQKCKSCGATQLRRNGTCMLCEICGETTGCS